MKVVNIIDRKIYYDIILVLSIPIWKEGSPNYTIINESSSFN